MAGIRDVDAKVAKDRKGRKGKQEENREVNAMAICCLCADDWRAAPNTYSPSPDFLCDLSCLSFAT